MRIYDEFLLEGRQASDVPHAKTGMLEKPSTAGS